MAYIGGRLTDMVPAGPVARTCRRMATRGNGHFKRLIELNTPVDTSLLKNSWHEKPLRIEPSMAGHTAYRTGVETEVEYAPYVEHGTGMWGPKHAKYEIRPKKPGGVLHWIGAGGEDVFATKVMHPGSPGAHMVAKSAGTLEGALPVLMLPELERWKYETEAEIRERAHR